MLELEVISKIQETPNANIVLLHGACLGAWVWEDNFIPYFSVKKWNVYALNFRNHGASKSKGSLRWNSIQNYVEDVEQLLSTISGDVILIGHSMGGMVIQNYLNRADKKVKAAVMLCAVPRQGVWALIGKLLLEYPFKFIQSTLSASWLPILNQKNRLKKLMFRADFPDNQLDFIQHQLQDESFLAFLQMLWNRPVIPKKHVPILVVGGGHDYLFSVRHTESLANSYQAESFILPQGSHTFMLESGWEEVAIKIEQFLRNLPK